MDVIKRFLKDSSEKSEVQVAMGRFRRNIVRVQTLIRTFLACRKARWHLLGLQWAKIDEARLSEYKKRKVSDLSKIKEEKEPGLRLKPWLQDAFNDGVRRIEQAGGLKLLKLFRKEVADSRAKFYHYFLPEDLQKFPEVGFLKPAPSALNPTLCLARGLAEVSKGRSHELNIQQSRKLGLPNRPSRLPRLVNARQ